MLKNRTLALLLSLTMLLTFMPAMAFAEEAADDASDQPAVAAEEAGAEDVSAEEQTDAEQEFVEEAEVVEEATEESYSEDALESEEAEVTSVSFIPVSGFELTGQEGGFWPDFYALGNKFILKYSDGRTEEYVCQTYLINNSEGYVDYDYFEKNTHDRLNYIYPVINGEEDGEFRYGIDNTVAFRSGDAYTEEFPVKVDPAPAALEFIPAAGVTLWAFEGAFNIEDDAFFAEGNSFIVTYTDGSKKTFVCEEEQLTKSKKISRYFEKNKRHKDANGVLFDEDFYYDHDIPDSGFAIGNNTIRFHVSGADGDVFSKEYNVIGKPEACTKHKLRTVKAVKATCQKQGVKKHYECSVCHKIFSDKKGKKETTYAKLATKTAKHVFKKKITSDEYLKSPATCTKKATYYYACKTCGEKGKKTFTAGKAKGHEFEQSLTKATPGRNGSIGQKCTVCGKKGKTKKILRASKIAVVKKYKKKGVPESALAGGKFIEVKNSKGKKIAAAEYEISFENNIEAGTGVATITFVGANYEGSKTVTYKIAK